LGRRIIAAGRTGENGRFKGQIIFFFDPGLIFLFGGLRFPRRFFPRPQQGAEQSYHPPGRPGFDKPGFPEFPLQNQRGLGQILGGADPPVAAFFNKLNQEAAFVFVLPPGPVRKKSAEARGVKNLNPLLVNKPAERLGEPIVDHAASPSFFSLPMGILSPLFTKKKKGSTKVLLKRQAGGLQGD
jgi:hypothetical protein